MKWMWSSALALALSAAVSAQSGKAMKDGDMAEPMTMTYTGCLVAVNHGGTFLLTHFDDKHGAMMQGDDMTGPALVLTGTDLKKHVGHKVTITGPVSHAMPDSAPNHGDTVAVRSLKMVAKSCP